MPTFIFIMFAFRYSLSSLNTVETIEFLSYFWAFIIISSTSNGIGIHLSKLRNYGLLKTYTLIAGGKRPIVYGVIITQLVFSAISLGTFTVFVSILYQLNALVLTSAGILLLLITFIPLTLFSFILTYPPMKDTSLSTIFNFLLYILFFLSFSNGNIIIDIINYINPFVFVMSIGEIMLSANQFSVTIGSFNYTNLIFILLLSLIGVYCYKKLNLVSEEYRS
ncbi:hypothetical protein GCM10028868_35290 [Virgibacillus kimchii]